MSHVSKKITITLLYFTLLISVQGLFTNPLKKFKEKAKEVFKKKFGKDKTWHFLGTDLTEYPGTDQKYRKINLKKWQTYYDCLNVQNSNLGKHLSATPSAVQGFEGGSIRFPCDICLSPKEQINKESVEWMWAGQHETGLEPVEYTEHTLLSPEDKTLHLYNLQLEHTGQYMCKMGESLTAPYFLTVVNSSENLLKQVYPKNAKSFPKAEPTKRFLNNKLILNTEYGEWSPCSSCNQVGKKHKLGYCTVSIAQETQINTSKRDNNSSTVAEISEKDLLFMQIFEEGIPCRSHILPDDIQNYPQVVERKDEIMTSFCKEKCQDDVVFAVKDKNGNIIEQANNSAGIYSMLQGPPPTEPAVERLLLYGVKKRDIIISCPGNLNSDTPVHWQMGGKNVVPELLAQESNGRIYISITDKIHIKKAKISDSNLFSCWQENELAGTIRLVVEKKIELSFNHHIMLVGMVIIMATFLYIFVKAFFGRKYAKITK